VASLSPREERRRPRSPRDLLALYRAVSESSRIRTGDASPCARDDSPTGLQLFDRVAYRGRSYRLVGLTPMGVEEPRAYLSDAETGERIVVPTSDLQASAPAD
jgi:hypothetical protein